jgi:hypothetical protein
MRAGQLFRGADLAGLQASATAKEVPLTLWMPTTTASVIEEKWKNRPVIPINKIIGSKLPIILYIYLTILFHLNCCRDIQTIKTETSEYS